MILPRENDGAGFARVAYKLAAEQVADRVVTGHSVVEDRVVTGLVGLIAQERFDPGSVGEGEYGNVWAELDEVVLSSAERNQLRQLLRLRAEGLVVDVWAMVQAEAQQSIERLIGVSSSRAADLDPSSVSV